MRVGVISDIHGNLPALDAVLNAMPSVDLLLCAGDLVGYYPDVNEVCDRIRPLGAGVIRGNHDAYVTGELTPDPAKAGFYRTEWTRACLTGENRAWLARLPVEMRYALGDVLVVLRHASPWDEETYLYPDSSQLDVLSLREKEICIFGHTHYPLWRQAGLGMVLNPGSAGQPRDCDPRASFAILDTVTGKADHVRCAYPVSEYQERLRKMNWDGKMIDILSREVK